MANLKTWQPPEFVDRERCIKDTEEILGQPDLPIKSTEDIFRINVLGMRASTDRGAWGNYIFDRVSGFTPTSSETIAPDIAKPGATMRIVGVRWEQREFAEFYADTGLGAPSTAALRPTCTGSITYTAQQFLRDQLVNLKLAANAAGVEEPFVSAIAPGSLEMFCRDQNTHYPTKEKFLEAIADAMREEYRAIVDAGFILQLDDPGLPGAWDMLDPQPSVEE